ncbi:MAG: F0F1 ATP synthase subunit gamma [Gammaproteobacteria bacterium]
MTDSTSGLRRKIESAGDLQSVVRTMKAIAASNVGQYEKSVRALNDYYRAVELGLSVCFRQGEPVTPAAAARPEARTGADGVDAIVFGSDQGLVGRFNEVIADHAMKTLADRTGHARIWAVGERVQARLSDAGVPLQGLFTVPASVKAITPLVGRILLESGTSHARPEAGELYLFYNRPASGADYEPVAARLLPLDDNWHRGLAALRWPTGNLPEAIGDRTATLRTLIGEYLFISLFRACAESLASENASRLAAMQRADQNIDGLLEHLRGTLQRVRQGSIDEELFDVISGFEALLGRDAPSAKSSATSA